MLYYLVLGALLLSPASCFAPSTTERAAAARHHRGAHAARMMSSEPLEAWLASKAGVSAKFVPSVLATCDEQMVGSVENLRTLQEAGLLATVFKPVIAASIERALAGGGAAAAPAGAPAAAGAGATTTTAMTLPEVKRLLALNAQVTWGTEAELRQRLEMFTQQSRQSGGAQWDAAASTWRWHDGRS